MNTINAVTSEPSGSARSMTPHDRHVLIARLLMSCAALTAPLVLMIALIVFAMVRSEQLHPSSHRSVASASDVIASA